MPIPSEHKYVLSTIDCLEKFKQKKSVKISSLNEHLNGVDTEIWFDSARFRFKFKINFYSQVNVLMSDIDKMFSTEKLSSNSKNYSCLKYALDNTQVGIGTNLVEGELKSLIEENLEAFNNKYLRFLIRLGEKSNTGVIEEYKSLTTDQEITYGVGYNQIDYAGEKLDVCYISIGDDKYLLLDSPSKSNIIDYDKRVDVVLIAFSYLFGTKFKSDCYVLSSSKSDFKTIDNISFYTRDKDYGHSSPIYNSHEICKYEFLNDYFLFPQSAMTLLCEKIKNEERFLRAIEIYIEATQNNFALSKCVLYSTCIETLVGLIKLENTSNPINPERLEESNVLANIEKIIKDSEVLTSEDKKFLIEKKLPYLNNPTNPDKIGLSIENFKIKLPDKFKKSLKYRNSYLHGNIPKGSLLSTKESDNYFRAFELQFLSNILILKIANYSGFLKNYSAEMEYYDRGENDLSKINLEHSLYYKI